LHFGQSVTNTAMNAIPKSGVVPGIGAVNDELIGAINVGFVSITGDVPHRKTIAFFDVFAA